MEESQNWKFLEKALILLPHHLEFPYQSLFPLLRRPLWVPRCDCDTAHKHVSGTLAKARPPPFNLSSPLHSALSGLKKKGDILILPAYKGRATVVVDKIDYDAKMFELLGDNQTYVELKGDPTPLIEKILNVLLLRMDP